MKKLGLITFSLALVVFLAVSVTAADYEVNEVKIDGITIDSGKTVYAETDSELEIEVFILYETGTKTYDDVKVKAWVGGYEYGDVEETTEPFTVEPGVSYRKVLKLALPDDMEGNADYKLHVQVYDSEEVADDYTYPLELRVQARRHSLKIQDVIIRPGSSVESGNPLFVTVRVENLGQKKEEDIRVSLSIPELGISARDYIDELTANEDADSAEDNEDEEDSASSDELYLRIPENTLPGTYTLNVNVDYNRGTDMVSTTKTITVVKPEEEVVAEEKPLVNFDSTSNTAAVGEEVAYKVTIANLNQESGIYSVEVDGESLFANSRIDPVFVVVPGKGSASINIYLTAKDSASAGQHPFVVKVLKSGELVREASLTLEVKEAEKPVSTQSYLVIGFIVLVVILIILGIAVLVGRGKAEEPRQYY
ncbi:MAG: hypothetical protein PHG05_03390 [Candidatus Nanoarchaeia archaeon]|nr:hypothetical protein [Candidatus Nanoarchaeia archaeon]